MPSTNHQKRKVFFAIPEHLDDHEPNFSKALVAEATYFNPETVTIVPHSCLKCTFKISESRISTMCHMVSSMVLLIWPSLMRSRLYLGCSIVVMRVFQRRWAFPSPLFHPNEGPSLELSGHFQCLDSSCPQGTNKGREPHDCVP